MPLLTVTSLVGAECDVPGCTKALRVAEPIPEFSLAERRFLRLLLCEGWVRRIGRSTRWYCPTHAERAGQCVKGRWGDCSPWCPVHREGRIISWATEDAKRLAGQRSLLTEVDR